MGLIQVGKIYLPIKQEQMFGDILYIELLF